MKSYIIFLGLVSLRCGGAEGLLKSPRNELEENLLAFFDMWLKGDPNMLLPLPPLHELTIPALDGTYKDNGIKLSYSMSKMKLTGLLQAFIPELVANVSETSLAARLVLAAPSLTLSTEQYKMDGRAFFIYPIKGEGEMRMNFQNCFLAIDVELGRNGKELRVDKLQFGLEVDKITIDLTGTSSLVKTTLNSKALSIFSKYRDAVQASLTESVVPMINSYLTGISHEQLLEILYSLRRRRPDSAFTKSLGTF